MRYLLARIKKDQEERIYRIYVTDSIYLRGKNQMLSKRYIDMITPEKVEHRKAEEIASDVLKNIGLKMV